MWIVALLPLLHAGPPIWAELAISDTEVVFSFSGEPEPLKKCLGIELDLVGPLDEAGQRAVREAFERFFAEAKPLSIDGREATPVLRDLEIPVDDPEEDGWLQVHARFAYACDAPPRTVAVEWHAFDGATWGGQTFVPITIVENRRVKEMISVYPEEPQHVWHAADAGARPRAIVPVVVEEPKEPLRVPALSIGVVAASIAGYGLLRKRTRPVWSGSLIVAGLLGAALLRDVGAVELRAPLERRVALPGGDQALSIFETLHRNIYDAFAATTEDEIYDLLAVSVDAALLDELYGEVYESLILREEGGAVCGIEKVDVLERAVRFPESDGAARFLVDWTWQVHGLVSHWGHVHRRTNEYDAEYDVRHDGRSWKVFAVDVREHRRIDVPDAPVGPDPTPDGTDAETDSNADTELDTEVDTDAEGDTDPDADAELETDDETDAAATTETDGR